MINPAKKILIAILCAALLICSAGCGEQTGNDNPAQDYTPIEVTQGDFSSVKEWDGTCETTVKFNGSNAEISGNGAAIDGAVLTISDEGDFMLSGSFDGQVVVDAPDCNVRLVLNGADIVCANSSAIYVANAKNVYITLADGTKNSVTDCEKYVLEDDTDEPNAAIFSHDDLIFDGTGALTVNANYNNGIRSKDDIEFISGSYSINAVDNGISGKDSVAVKDGTFVISAGGDAIRSTNDTDTEKGWISIAGGSFDIDAGQDGIQAYTTLSISGGVFDICTSGGMKAVKSGNDMRLAGGNFVMDSTDDCIHSGGSIEISGGEFLLSSRDDAIHSDNALVINDGVINITQSYEGIEAASVDINGGAVSLISSDDGINVAGGNDNSAFGGPGGFDGPGGGFGEGSDKYYVSITGGTVNINADGDGIDSNGNIFIEGGNTYISGSENDGNTAVDYAISFEVNGGTFVAFGSAGMAVNASQSSTQPVMMASLSRTAAVGISISITAADGTVIYSGQPEKDYRNVMFSHPSMKVGDNVTIVIDTETAELPIEDTITTYGSQNGMGGHGGGMGGGPGGGPGGPGGR